MTRPEVNIGLIGHVDHGKTTLTERLSGVWTDRHSEEIKRGITIRLGYADCTFYECAKCKDTAAYGNQEKCATCKGKAKELRTVSLVDAPGHETLMATMLSGAAIMDGALLIIAANEKCPQPQTKEHLMAIEIVGIKNIIIVQTKIDLVTEQQALENHKAIKAFVKGTVAENAPIIPVSAQHNTNTDVLIQKIEEVIPTPVAEKGKDPLMLIARSFDINKPGSTIDKLKGTILGGALVEGTLKKGDEIEICPGKNGKPIRAKIVSINSGNEKIDEVSRGGTFGLETLLDPAQGKSDQMVGQVLGHPGKLPPVATSLDLEIHLLERVVGSEEELAVKPLALNEALMMNVGTATTLGTVSAGKKGNFKFALKRSVCAKPGSRVTLARRYGTRWRLIGYGVAK